MADSQPITETISSQPRIEYRDVNGFPVYRIGNDGSAWTCWIPAVRGNGWQMSSQWRCLNLDSRRHGRLYATFSRNGISQSFQVHRLVLGLFVGPCPEGMEACHEDGNHLNNALSNLRWDTHVENMGDMVRHGTRPRNESHGNRKLSWQLVNKIRAEVAGGLVRGDILRLSEKYGISRSQIGRIVHGDHWKP